MRNIFTLIFLLFFTSIFSQSVDEKIRNIGTNLKYKEKIKHIEGSPYYTDKFQNGKLILSSGEVKIYDNLNYNAFIDRFEFLDNDNKFIIANPGIIDTIVHSGHIFQYKDYTTEEGEQKTGFLILLAEGKCDLYKKEIIEFKPYEQTSGHFENKPDRFKARPPKYFLKKGDSNIKEIDSFRKRKFLRLYFKNNKDEFLEYIKNNNLRLRKEEDLIEFIEYYNNTVKDNA